MRWRTVAKVHGPSLALRPYELEHGGFGYRQGQLDAVARRVPAGPVAQGAGVAAGGVLGRGFGQQLSDRIGSLLGQLFGQC